MRIQLEQFLAATMFLGTAGAIGVAVYTSQSGGFDAALERIRGAADSTLAGGVAIIGELDDVPERLAVTDDTIAEVANGAVRYAGSVGKLLG